MPSLLDNIEHFATAAKAIHTSVASVIGTQDNPLAQTAPFTRAVLDTALGDLIRDIDASELGLFTIVPPPDADLRKKFDNGATKGEISRVGFPGATPLRKPPTRRNEVTKPKELDPEVYARAALKYLDRYQSIRPMPRARSQVVALLDQLDEVRNNVQQLNEILHELTSSAPSQTTAPAISSIAEESRISDLQSYIAELKMKKNALLRANQPQSHDKSTSLAALARPPQHQPAASATSDIDITAHEDAFWSTPGTSARTLRFTDKVMDENVVLGELSGILLDSPDPPAPRAVFSKLVPGRGSEDALDDSIFTPENAQDDNGLNEAAESVLQGLETEETGAPDQDPEEAEDDGEQTVVLKKAPPLSSPRGDPPQTVEQERTTSKPVPNTKIRVTPELERIVAKIWKTVGEVIMPGNSYSSRMKPPQAKETLALIQSLAIQSPSSLSPSSSSISSLPTFDSASGGSPTPQQVNIAQLLHALLTAPNHAMQLNKLKTIIDGTRALYACVAKKLIRIDRGGGEQIVLFDV